MHTVLPLADLGRRIMILGPSSSGKSTLAQALSRRLSVPAIHLDQLRHLPETDWQERPDAEFHSLHDAAILQPEWVMDGSYSVLMPQRLARATGMIVVDDHYVKRFGRYFWRSTLQRRRAGGLEGNRDSIKWAMISWIWKTRYHSAKARQRAVESGLPYVFCHSMNELKTLYRQWGLDR